VLLPLRIEAASQFGMRLSLTQSNECNTRAHFKVQQFQFRYEEPSGNGIAST
jgi:hypothetical protein